MMVSTQYFVQFVHVTVKIPLNFKTFNYLTVIGIIITTLDSNVSLLIQITRLPCISNWLQCNGDNVLNSCAVL